MNYSFSPWLLQCPVRYLVQCFPSHLLKSKISETRRNSKGQKCEAMKSEAIIEKPK